MALCRGAVLCCAVLCCAVALCCAVPSSPARHVATHCLDTHSSPSGHALPQALQCLSVPSRVASDLHTPPSRQNPAWHRGSACSVNTALHGMLHATIHGQMGMRQGRPDSQTEVPSSMLLPAACPLPCPHSEAETDPKHQPVLHVAEHWPATQLLPAPQSLPHVLQQQRRNKQLCVCQDGRPSDGDSV